MDGKRFTWSVGVGVFTPCDRVPTTKRRSPAYRLAPAELDSALWRRTAAVPRGVFWSCRIALFNSGYRMVMVDGDGVAKLV